VPEVYRALALIHRHIGKNRGGTLTNPVKSRAGKSVLMSCTIILWTVLIFQMKAKNKATIPKIFFA
jgi:hypothetical protein